MSSSLVAVIALLAVVLVWAIVTYNRLVAMRNGFRNAFAQIDVQLKRRYDLIPNLVAAAKAYMTHERQTLEAVIEARQRASGARKAAALNPADGATIAALDAANEALSGRMTTFFGLMESYPELRADATIAQLTEELTSTENRVAFARQAFNDAVMSYNTERESFPTNLVAVLTGFAEAALLRATQSRVERQAVRVQF